MTDFGKPMQRNDSAALLTSEKVRANGHTPREDELDIAWGGTNQALIEGLAALKNGGADWLENNDPSVDPTILDDEDRTAANSTLAAMNEKYAVVNVSGKTRVVSMEESLTYPGCKVPVYSSISDFCAFHANRRKSIVSPDGKERVIGVGRWWVSQEKRRQYDGIIYSPGGDGEKTKGKLNLWAGFGCQPSGERYCSKYLAHLLDNVCSGIAEHAEYLLNWMAYGVQHPARPGEVAVVMRGKEGVGKGVAAREYGRLFGSHFRHISQAGHLTGHFNAHLQMCSVLFADKAFFAGDRSHELILKALITEETLMIEPKGLDPYPVRNCLHLIMSSNNDWVIPAGADARRYFVLSVADTHKQDHGYFAAITQQMDAGGREALLHHLLKRDLSKFNVREVPQTDGLADQKAHSRRGVDRLVELVAHSGILPAADHPHVAITSGEERGSGFYAHAKSLVPDLRYNSIDRNRRCSQEGVAMRTMEKRLPQGSSNSLRLRS